MQLPQRMTLAQHALERFELTIAAIDCSVDGALHRAGWRPRFVVFLLCFPTIPRATGREQR